MISTKRGLSTVVATVLIILVTIVVTGIIAEVVINFTNDELKKSKECLDYREYFTFDENLGYTCTDKRNSGVYHGFSIHANVGEQDLSTAIGGFNVVLTKDASSKVIEIKKGQVRNYNAGGVWMFGTPENMILPVNGEVITYVYNATPIEYTKAEVYPVLSSGRICELSDSIRFQPCGGLNLTG